MPSNMVLAHSNATSVKVDTGPVLGSNSSTVAAAASCNSSKQSLVAAKSPALVAALDRKNVDSTLTCSGDKAVEKHEGTTDAPFKCEICSKGFKSRRSLQSHQYVDHTEPESEDKPKTTPPDVPTDSCNSLQTNHSSENKADESNTISTSLPQFQLPIKDKWYTMGIPSFDRSQISTTTPDVKSLQLKDMDTQNNNKPVDSQVNPNIPTMIAPVLPSPHLSSPEQAAMLNQFYSSPTYKLWQEQYIAAVYAASMKNGIPAVDYTAQNNFLAMQNFKLSTTNAASIPTTAATPQSISQGLQSPTSGMNTVGKPAMASTDPYVAKPKLVTNVIGGGSTADLDPAQLLECPHCGKLCRKPCDLKRHLMMHTGEKPFKCKVCGQKFRAKGSMMYHQKAAHGIDVKLTPGLEERYLRARANQQHRKLMQITQLGQIITPIDSSSETNKQSKVLEEPKVVKEEPKTEVKQRSSSSTRVVTRSTSSNEANQTNTILKTENNELESTTKKSVSEVERLTSTESEDSAFVSFNSSNITSSTDGINKADALSYDSGYQNDSSERSLSLDEGLVADDVSRSKNQDGRPCPRSISLCDQLPDSGDEEMGHNNQKTWKKHGKSFTPKQDEQNVKSKQEMFKCTQCGQLFGIYSKLQEHLVTHAERTTANDLCPCSHCSAVFDSNLQLGNHLRSVHKITDKEQMQFSDEEYSNESPVDEGLGSSTSQLDTDPLVDYKAEKDQEVDKIHLDEIDDRPIKQEEKLSNADEDNRKLMRMKIDYDESAKFKHLESIDSPGPKEALHTSTPTSEDSDQLSVTRNKDGMYNCTECSSSFSRLFSLQRHKRVHTGFKPCFCRVCGKGFSEPRNLRQHIVRFHPDQDTEAAFASIQTTPTGRKTSVSPEAAGSPLAPYLTFANVAGAKRARETYGRQSQRLLKVTPDMLEEVGKDALNLSFKSSTEEQADEPAEKKMELDQSASFEQDCKIPINNPEVKAESIPNIASQVDDNIELLEDAEKEIRAKERLDDDTIVVIPSDSPLDPPDKDQHIPVESPEPLEAGEVKRPAWKHLLLNKQRNRRQSGMFTNSESEASSSNQGITRHHSLEQEHNNKPAAIRQMSADSAIINQQHASTGLSPAMSTLMNPMGFPMMGFAGSNQLYYNQALITSGLMPYVASGMRLSNPMQNLRLKTDLKSSKVDKYSPSNENEKRSPTVASSSETKKSVASSTSTSTEPTEQETTESLRNRRTGTGWLGETNQPDALNYTRSSSSLSRKHSRLPLVNNGAAIKRDEACKPVNLSDGRTVYRCTYCSKDFTSHSDINRHMDFHEDIRPYKCKFCEYYARTNSQLKVHMMRHQGIREFHCKLCNYKGVTQSDLNRHMKSQIHMMKAHNQCQLCGEGFVSQKNLQRHQVMCPSTVERMSAARDLLAMSNVAANNI